MTVAHGDIREPRAGQTLPGGGASRNFWEPCAGQTLPGNGASRDSWEPSAGWRLTWLWCIEYAATAAYGSGCGFYIHVGMIGSRRDAGTGTQGRGSGSKSPAPNRPRIS